MIDPIQLGILGVSALVLLLLLGVHVGIALLAVGGLGIAYVAGPDVGVSMATTGMYHTFASYELITLPLFIFMGYLASVGGVSEKVFCSANDWLGKVRGGIGISTVMSCTAFGAVCGSSIVTSSVFARLCAPEMRKYGYDKQIAYGICAASGMIGMLIPPSILMVVYGIFSGESIGKLLIAGIAPGLLLTVLFSAVTIFVVKRIPADSLDQTQATPGLKKKLLDLVSLWQIWVVAIVIFGGSLGGVFNPTEAAAIASVVMAIVVVATRWHTVTSLFREAFSETAYTTAMVFLIMGGATVFSRFLALTGLTDVIGQGIASVQIGKFELLLLILLFYMVLGCFLDSISILSITIPVLNPVVQSVGWDPIWYAVLIIMTVEIGLITPPVGLNVYASFSVAEKDVSLADVFRGVTPYLIASGIAVLFLIAFPGFSTYLPKLFIS